MSDQSTFKLVHAMARQRAMEAVRNAPDGYAVIVKPPTRNLEQNAHLHAWISEIAKVHEWAGKKRDIETWKRLLTAAWLRARGEPVEFLPALDGMGVDVVFRRTSDMTRVEFAELSEFVIAWAVEHGIGVDS